MSNWATCLSPRMHLIRNLPLLLLVIMLSRLFRVPLGARRLLSSVAASEAPKSSGTALKMLVAFGIGCFAANRYDASSLLPIADDSKKAAKDFNIVYSPTGPFDSIMDAVGHTPLVELKSLSEATGCRIFVKCEHLNPGLSIKDRAARQMLVEAEKAGLLVPGQSELVEATGGNTGVSLAMFAATRGYGATFTMPDKVTKEKQNMMTLFGAKVVTVPPAPFSSPNHFYKRAKQMADESNKKLVFLDQFENKANFRAHFEGTGPEIWNALDGKLTSFVCAMGTGGTMSGCSAFLKQQNEKIKTAVMDPPGSALLTYFASDRKDMTADSGSTFLQGVGIARETSIIKLAHVDGGFRSDEQECIEMCDYLLRNEGLFVGPSAASNVCGAVKMAKLFGQGQVIATVLCDSGTQYATTVYDEAWRKKNKLVPVSKGKSIDFIKVGIHAGFRQYL